MSEDITNIRKNIREIVRRANAMEPKANKDDQLKEYHEHRRKFLTNRNKFEQAEHIEVKEKKPFIPDWVKSEQNQPVSIIYKLKGSEVTDIRTDLTQDKETFGLSRRSINRSL
ncbi:uncharacterized protein LOC107265447 [Cephus cinctus]|uniref:Uncharacterized protein LOC107265447 n=1 Tax=Cephus cinctus TaxID=211228 RepID=A0AAJ7RCW0_CEPCN|nr:uncharacterized protein LOC107265447 [Cephus cinctus]